MSKRSRPSQPSPHESDPNAPDHPSKRRKVDTQQKRDREWKDMASEFLQSDWQILSNHNVQLKQALSVPRAGPNSRVVLREMQEHPEQLFFTTMSSEIFDKLASIVNHEMTSKKNKKLVSVEQAKRYSPVDANAMIRWYGLVLYLENSYSRRIDNIRAILTSSRREMNLPFGENRYLAIMGCLHPTDSDFDSIFSVIRANMKSAINLNNGPVVSVDESIFSYHVSRVSKNKYELARDPVPEVTIPRKPHSTGLKVFLMTTKLMTNLVYTLDFQPYVHSDPVTPQDSIRRFLSRWPPNTIKPHIVADSAFGSIQFAQELTRMQVAVTFSVRASDHPFLWTLMRRGIQDGQWIASATTEGLMASEATGDPDAPRYEEEERGYHKLITNAFTFQRSASTQPQQSDIWRTTPGTGQTYTEEFLNAKTQIELREIAKSEGVRPSSKTKQELVTRIQRICNPTALQATAQQQVLRQFDDTVFTTRAPHHRYYRENFSNVDTHNSYWYKYNYRYRLHDWRGKLLLSVFETAVINVWCLANSLRRDDLLSFRERLATALMRFGLDTK